MCFYGAMTVDEWLDLADLSRAEALAAAAVEWDLPATEVEVAFDDADVVVVFLRRDG